MKSDYRIVYMPPQVIPAEPGYFCAGFCPKGGFRVSETTTVDDLELVKDRIIAWIVRPAVKEPYDNDQSLWDGSELDTPEVQPDGSELDTPEVQPVIVGGPVAANMPFILDPDGNWELPHNGSFETEDGAREQWLSDEKQLLERHHERTAQRK